MSRTSNPIAECRFKRCLRDNCWFSHTQGQKPEKKTAPVVASIPEKKTVEQPAPVVAKIPEQSPELHAEFCHDSDDDDYPTDERDCLINIIDGFVFLCLDKKKLEKILNFIVTHLFNTYGVNYDNDEDFYDDHTDLSYYREKIVFIANDQSLPYNDLVLIKGVVNMEILG